MQRLQSDPFELGRRLTAALGDDALLELLEADPDRLLLLDADDESDSVPWEFAATEARELLVTRFGLLRPVDANAPPAGATAARWEEALWCTRSMPPP